MAPGGEGYPEVMDEQTDPGERPFEEVDVEAGARSMDPAEPAHGTDPGPRPHGDTPRVRAPNADHPAPGTSETSPVVHGVAPPAGPKPEREPADAAPPRERED